MLLSIVTVVRNDAAGLQRTAGAVRAAMSLRPDLAGCVEHLIIDGASTDQTVKVAEEYSLRSPWKTSIYSEVDSGVYDAMNKGVALAQGWYVLFLNAGDELHGDSSLVTACDHLARNVVNEAASAGIAFGAYVDFGFWRRYIAPRHISQKHPRMPTIHQSMIYLRSVLIQYPYCIKYVVCGDYEQFSRILMAGLRFRLIDQPLAVFYPGGISTRRVGRLVFESMDITRSILGRNTVREAIVAVRLLSATAVYMVIFGLSKVGRIFRRRA